MATSLKSATLNDVDARGAQQASGVRRGIPYVVLAAVAVAAMALALSYQNVLAWLGRAWTSNPDYSHGPLVPLFSLALLWLRRESVPSRGQLVSTSAFAAGALLIGLGVAMQAGGIYTRTMTVEAVSLLPYIAGMLLCWGGWQAARWAWPAVAFLLFMFPIPGAFSGLMSEALQRLATIASTFLLQLIGLPAISEGNIIWLSESKIGVAEACSGLRMLVSFFALTIGACFIIRRPLWEKIAVVVSAPLIAIAANVARITATGLAYDFGNQELADKIFHDLAGWLMMPFGLVLLFAELAILGSLFLPPVEKRDFSRMGMEIATNATARKGTR